MAANGIDQLEWRRLRRIVGLEPWGEQILLRLKNHAFPLYDMTQGRMGCPHTCCIRLINVNLHHVFWTCPAVVKLRQQFLQKWIVAGLGSGALEHAVFSLTLPSVPARIWEVAESLNTHIGQLNRTLLTECITLVAESCWRVGAALYFHSVWRWRVAHFDALNDVTEGHHCARLASRLRNGYDTVHLHLRRGNHSEAMLRASTILRRTLATSWHSCGLNIPCQTARYVLFFYGGSRGNPGPGGSGAAVVRVGASLADVQVYWLVSMSYAAKTTTNNLAENMGLLAGLRACLVHQWAPLHVVGDSLMIIRQHSKRKPPLAKHLKDVYWQSRRVADRLGVLSWQHHLRSYNKMADTLANIAMDSKISAQRAPTTLPVLNSQWTATAAHAQNDVGHWIARNLLEGSSEPASATV